MAPVDERSSPLARYRIEALQASWVIGSWSEAVPSKESSMKPTDEQQAFWQTVGDLMPFNASGVQALRIHDMDAVPEEDRRGRKRLEGWKMSWIGEVQPDWANLTSNLHGAAAAWIVDVCTSAAIMSHSTETFWGPPMVAGVSLAINMTYFHPAKVGTRILVEVEVLKCSQTSANLQCNIIDAQSRKLYASGTHLKAWRARREGEPRSSARL